jgi:hypothetical protein
MLPTSSNGGCKEDTVEHSKEYLIWRLLSVAAMSLIVLSGTTWAAGNDASREMQFAVLLDGPITINESGDWSTDLYSIDGTKVIGRMVRHGGGQAGCLNFASDVPPPPFLPPCANAPALRPGQFYYERYLVTFEFPGGTLIGSLRGWEAFNANPPVHGGIKSGAAVEEGKITGGTGIYKHVQGAFFSRISDEFQTVDFFGYLIDAPIWFNKSIVVFTLKKGD